MTWGKISVNADHWCQTTRNVYGVNGYSPQVEPDRITGSSLLYEDDNVRNSVSTPGFRKQKRRQLPDHPHYWQKKKWDKPRSFGTKWFLYSNGVMDRDIYHGPSGQFQAHANENGILYPGDDPYNQAVSRLQNGSEEGGNGGYNGVRLSNGSLGVGLAEAHKTASHLASTATRLVNAFRSLRRGHLGDFAQGLGLTVRDDKVRAYRNRYFREKGYGSDMSQFAAQSWLEFTYGWKPLVIDLYAQAKNLAEIMIERQYVVRELRTTAKSRRFYTENQLYDGGLGNIRKVVDVKRRVSLTVRYSVHEGGHTAQNVFGLNNPALIAWEIVPFSFVADWFLPVGDWLDSLTAYDGLVFHSGTRTDIREAEITEQVTTNGSKLIGNPTTWWSSLDATATNSCFYKTRSLLTSFPRKTLEFKDPRSFAHAASAIALIQSVFQGSRGRQATSVKQLGNKTLADFGGSVKNYRKYFPDSFAHL